MRNNGGSIPFALSSCHSEPRRIVPGEESLVVMAIQAEGQFGRECPWGFLTIAALRFGMTTSCGCFAPTRLGCFGEDQWRNNSTRSNLSGKGFRQRACSAGMPRPGSTGRIELDKPLRNNSVSRPGKRRCILLRCRAVEERVEERNAAAEDIIEHMC